MSQLLTLLDQFFMTSHGIVVCKILFASLLGAFIGLERELKKKPIGIKTCIIIATTTCILTVVSIHAAEYYAEVSQNIRTDPMRLAAQVISGIGFLGAGVILRKSDDAISGLTTAAIIWAAAGVGIAVGAGFYFDAFVAAFMIFCAVKISPLLMLFLHPKKSYIERAKLTMRLTNSCAIERVTQRLVRKHHRIDSIAIKDIPDGLVELDLKLTLKRKETASELYLALKQFDEIVGIELVS